MKKVTKRIFEEEEKRDEAIRINKYLSDSGVCSRREADSNIEQGKVLIDGKVAVMGSKVLPGQQVTFLGKPIRREEKMVLIAFNKPKGIVCTTDKREPDNIIDFIKYGSRIYPIGRLDKDSEGLILLTNNGDIVNKILRAGNNHEKEYIVRVNQVITAGFLKSMAEGVPILDTVTRPCTIEAIDKYHFRIILTQGLNRQIRRMCEYLGYRVLELQRIRIMNVNLGRLQLGGYRNLTDRELDGLKELILASTNMPIGDEIDDEMVDVRTFEDNLKKVRSGKSTGKSRSKAMNFNKDSNTKKSKSFKDSKDRFKSKGFKDSKGRKEQTDRKELTDRNETTGRKEFVGRNEQSDRKDSTGRREFKGRNEQSDRKDSTGRREFKGRNEQTDRKDSSGRREFKGRNEQSDRKDSSGRREFKGRNEQSDRKDLAGRKEFKGRNEQSDRKDLAGRKEFKGRNEQAGRKEQTDRKEYAGRKEQSGSKTQSSFKAQGKQGLKKEFYNGSKKAKN